MNKTKTKKELIFLSIEMLVVVLVFLASFIVSIYIIKNIVLEAKGNFDTAVSNYVGQYVSDSNTSVMNFFTFFGSQFFLVPVYLLLIAYYLFFKKDRWMGLKVAAVSISSLLIMFSLKQFFGRERPLMPLLNEVNGLSFPSGHSFMSFSLCGILIYIIHKMPWDRSLKYLAYLLLLTVTFFVGLSRIYLRVHYPSDVVAGFCMGMIWVVISLFVIKTIERKSTMRLEN